jgi:magnesium transporter
MTSQWIDLVDPDEAELRSHVPRELHARALDQLLEAARLGHEPRPTLESHGAYAFGVLLVPVAVPVEDRVFYQEIDLVLTRELVLTVRKTPPGEQPFDTSGVHAACDAHGVADPGMIVYYLVDAVAERHLDLIDDLNGEIDELEDHVEEWSATRTRERVSELRHDVLRIRRTLAPTRDAIRHVVDGRLELDGPELFTAEMELHFADAYDKLLRASDGLELSRDLVAGARDYSQAKIANDQNEATKRLTAVASIWLVPTFLVGVWGQNFEHMPELRWRLGYLVSWAVIVTTVVAQYVYFKRKRYL